MKITTAPAPTGLTVKPAPAATAVPVLALLIETAEPEGMEHTVRAIHLAGGRLVVAPSSATVASA